EIGSRELWLSVSAVGYEDGTVYAFRDLTEERALETMRQDIVATVSHELRTPLAAIYGAALTLRRDDIDLEAQLHEKLLEVITEESDRLAAIVNDLLLASQLGTGTDRKSTRLNSSHVAISYAVFCLKKKIPHQHRAGKSRVDTHMLLPRNPLRCSLRSTFHVIPDPRGCLRANIRGG